MGYPLPANDPLGTDLRLNANGDLGTTIAGDLDVVTEADNVAQAVRVQMTTNAWDYLWGNDVGGELATYVDQPITQTTEQNIQTDVTNILARDTRIIAIQGVDIDGSTPDQLIVTPKALVNSVGVVQTPVVIKGGNGA